MQAQSTKSISDFYVIGINYRKTDAAIRGNFAVNADQYSEILIKAGDFALDELFVLSTCNRTEMYGFAGCADQMIALLCTVTAGDISTFKNLAYIKNGQAAVEHVYSVAAGLDSQILGDYEIVGQLKNAVKHARENGFVGSFLERVVNSALQASKGIKNQTQISGGTVSVSFAAIQYIKEFYPSILGKKILLLGTGKIGRNTCKNLIDYLDTTNITLINRTQEKADVLAKELGLSSAPLTELKENIEAAEIILVATNSPKPTILKSHLENTGDKLIIDLSIPYNVEATAAELENVQLVNVDELSKLKDETLQKREAEVPRAKEIIAEHIEELMEWYALRKHVPFLKSLKTRLKSIHSCNLYLQAAHGYIPAETEDDRIQKVINGMAVKMRQQNQYGCQYLEALNDYMEYSKAN